MAKLEVLSLNRVDVAEEALSKEFVVHRLYAATDKEQLLRDVGPRIQVIQGTGSTVVSSTLIDALPALRLICLNGVGYDGIDLAAAKRRGIALTNTPGVVDACVADLALGMIVAFGRQLLQADAFVRSGKWLQGPMPLARKVTGARLGIMGLGNIGLALAKRAAGFDMKIGYHNRKQRADVSYTYYDSLNELAANSDYLVVLTPGGDATKHIVNEQAMRALGPNGVLVNISRGSVVDQAALIRCLTEGALGGAALDVYDEEPKVPEKLIKLPNVLLAPHMGTGTRETRLDMAELMLNNMRAFAAGKPLLTPVN